MHLNSNIKSSCTDCGFSSHDIYLLNNHNCDIQQNGGQCEDFPCCGHERGDCNGLLYGSDEATKNDPHLLCDHEFGECDLDYGDYDEDQDEDLDLWVPPPLVIHPPEGSDPGAELYES